MYSKLKTERFLLQQFNGELSVCVSCSSILFAIIRQKGVKHSTTCARFCCWWKFWLCFCTKVFQCNDLNRHIYITPIAFRLYLVCKTGYHYLGIINTTKHIFKNIRRLNASWRVLTQWCVPRMHTCGRWNARCFWNVETFLKVINRCLHHNKLFSCVYFCGWHRSGITQT